MAKFFFYNNKKPRKFNHKPITYNPDEIERKKRLQKRINAVKREMGVLAEEDVNVRKDFKAEFVSKTNHLKKRQDRIESGKNTYVANNGVLIIIALILIAVFFFFFFC